MYKDIADIIKELFMESRSLKGAIEEVILKCKLLKSRLVAEREICDKITDKLQYEIDVSTEQMQADLARYQQRLDEIYEELEGHGIIQ